MWLKCPGTLSLHFSQSARYPMLKLFFIPGCHVQLLMVCLLRMWPLRSGEGPGESVSLSGGWDAARGSTSIMALGCSISWGGGCSEADIECSYSEIGDGSRRLFCTVCQSASVAMIRGTAWSFAVLGCRPLAVHSRCCPLTCAAKLGWIGVGMRFVPVEWPPSGARWVGLR